MESTGSIRAQIGTLIFATSVIQLANGFFTTFFSLRLSLESFGATKSGLVLSSFFLGFTLGALRCGRIIERIGHIRAYAAFAGAVVAATATMPLKVGPWAWLILRAVVGFGCAGIFVTTESWLNAKAAPSERGRIFSTYMVGTFLALAVGQLLISRTEIEGSEPFNAIVVLFAIALVMVTSTRDQPPLVTPTEKLPYSHLLREAPVAVIACAISGVITSSFYALVPVWAMDEGVRRENIALFMLAAVLGGLAFQVPVGRLSDRFDRRKVLAALGFGFAASAIMLIHLPPYLMVILPVAPLLGGFMSTLYPVCVSNAHDRMPGDRVVAVSGQLILINGLGAVVGPIIGTTIMARFGINGLFYFLTACAIILAVCAACWSLLIAAPQHLRRTFRILTPQAATLAHDPVGACSDAPAPSVLINLEEE
jgi:MFS family permease